MFDPYEDEPLPHNEKLLVAEAMQMRGGSFMQNLGRALEAADADNARRIRAAWPDAWSKYLAFSQLDADRERE